MNYNSFDFDSQYAPSVTRGKYATSVFGWMFLGLMTTFLVAIAMIYSGYVYYTWTVPGIQIGLMIAQLAVVIILSRRVYSFSVASARLMFFLYAALTGVTFSSILLIYGLGTSVFVFGLTAVYFGVLAAYGHFTGRDLSGMGSILTTGLIFLIVVGVLSMFLSFDAFDSLICIVGIAIFLGFTAYDTQMMGRFYDQNAHNQEILQRGGVIIALRLYLDFINLFLYLLRFMGNRKN